MGCDIERHGEQIRICGEMTIYDAAAAKGALLAALQGHIGACLLDMSQVSEIDSTGLQLLLMARRSALGRAAAFGVVTPSTAVRELLGLLHLNEVIREL